MRRTMSGFGKQRNAQEMQKAKKNCCQRMICVRQIKMVRGGNGDNYENIKIIIDLFVRKLT